MRSTLLPSITLPLLLSACGSPQTSDQTTGVTGNDAVATATALEAEADAALANEANSAVAYSPDQLSMICRAGVAASFGRSHKIMKAVRQSDGLVRVSYRRPDDSKLWKSDCKVEGNRIVWRTVDAFGPGSGTGRWRTGPEDDTLTFKIDGNAVTTASSDGSSASETYKF